MEGTSHMFLRLKPAIEPAREQAGMIRLVILLMVLVLCAMLTPPEYTLGLVAKYLRVDDPILPADAVVILQGDQPGRVLKAFELVKKGYTNQVVFASGYVPQEEMMRAPRHFNWPSGSLRYLTALTSLGLDMNQIAVVDSQNDYDTAHELKSISRWATSKGFNRLILVSSPSHTRRVKIIWERISSIRAQVVSSDAPGFEQWWKHGEHRRAVGYECGALIKEGSAQVWSFLQSLLP